MAQTFRGNVGLETWGRHKAKTTTLLIEGKRLPPGARRGLGRGQRYYKIAPGIYAERARWEALSRDDKLRLHGIAHVLSCTNGILCGQSAALMWGLPIARRADPNAEIGFHPPEGTTAKLQLRTPRPLHATAAKRAETLQIEPRTDCGKCGSPALTIRSSISLGGTVWQTQSWPQSSQPEPQWADWELRSS